MNGAWQEFDPNGRKKFWFKVIGSSWRVRLNFDEYAGVGSVQIFEGAHETLFGDIIAASLVDAQHEAENLFACWFTISRPYSVLGDKL